MGNVNDFGCGCTKLGVKTIQDGNLEPLSQSQISMFNFP
jgi:hypothetical protein